MARDIEAEVKVKDSSKAGFDSVARRSEEAGLKVRKTFDNVQTEIGKGFLSTIGAVSPKIAATLAESLGSAGALGGPLLAAAVITAAPLIAGAIGSAVTGGAVGLGIVGGVLAATQDSRIKTAGANLGNTLLTGLQDKAGVFVQPILRSIDIIEDRFDAMGDRIGRIFGESSRYVEPLITSLTTMAEYIVTGIERAVLRAGPIIDEFARGFEEVGKAVGLAFDLVSENAEANAFILNVIFSSIRNIILGVAFAIKFIGDALEGINKIIPITSMTSQNLASALGMVDENQKRVGSGSFGVQEGFLQIGAAADVEAKALEMAEASLKENEAAARSLLNANNALFDSTTRVGLAQSEAAEAVKKNGRTLDENTEKGRANRGALSNLAGALNTYREGLATTGASSRRLDGVLAQQRESFIKVATQMTGNRTKAVQLADALLGIPSSRNTKITADTTAAQKNAQNLRDEINNVNSKSVTLTVNVNDSRLRAVENRLNRVTRNGAALGGQGSYAFNTTGPGARTGGAVQVENTTYVSLDGKPFYDYTELAISAHAKHRRFREKVGWRDDH